MSIPVRLLGPATSYDTLSAKISSKCPRHEHYSETGSFPWTIPRSDIPLDPARSGLRVSSGVSRVRVRVRFGVKFVVGFRGNARKGNVRHSGIVCHSRGRRKVSKVNVDLYSASS